MIKQAHAWEVCRHIHSSPCIQERYVRWNASLPQHCHKKSRLVFAVSVFANHGLSGRMRNDCSVAELNPGVPNFLVKVPRDRLYLFELCLLASIQPVHNGLDLAALGLAVHDCCIVSRHPLP